MQAIRLRSRLSLVYRKGIQRRLLATPPSTPLGPTSSPTTLAGTVPPTTPGSPPIRPVVITNAPTPAGTNGIPPPPPPPPPKQRRFFRRLILYTSIGALIFYPTSGWLSTHYETYRDLFITLPGGELVADYADEHGWQSFGYGTMSKKVVEVLQWAKGEVPSKSTAETIREGKDDLMKKIEKARLETGNEVHKLSTATKEGLGKVKNVVSGEKSKTSSGITHATEVLKERTEEIKEKAVEVKERAKEMVEHVREITTEAGHKIAETAKEVPFNFSDGVEGIVREAERALSNFDSKTSTLPVISTSDVGKGIGPRVMVDTQRPRELKPETVTPQKPSFEGKEIYKTPLPLGFEPPPGYYIPPPPKPEKNENTGKTLPLLGPKVKEFAIEEPIIAQLASTIDSLTTSLAGTAAATSSEAGIILTKAQEDLSALNGRLTEVKRVEKERMEKTVGEKIKDFEIVLKEKETERLRGEQGLKEEWEKERGKMVEEWRKALEGELEVQREGIEKRLREEVISQGIELQRRWLRSIKSQVESERGGRLAKLDNLTTSLKQLERITLDNSATLDDNVKLHKLWSALRAIQTKVNTGDITFEEELRVLKNLVSSSSSTSSSSQTSSSSLNSSTSSDGFGTDSKAITIALTQLEKSNIPQTGIKSFSSLATWFTQSVAPRIHSASLVPDPEEAGVISHLASKVLSKVMFSPKAGLVDGDDVGSVLARAEWCLAQKDLDGAAREVNRLKGWPAKLAGDWLREARRTLEVNQALEIVATEATLSSLLLV
ncbi:hypothetical protein M231_02842 [Tremella mesenterica]|uniref:MICOS complex subunit MIC60 n=1 Tax=Tremella mesenterica TaxID=5217 RepID=A0A4Q1BPS8_TREME|nr:hypothetical protein M231_02842 [Tremella mesenterica]